MTGPVELAWNLEVPTPIERTWEAFADTDRFNKAAGLGFRFEEVPQPDGSVHRTGRVARFGMVHRWEELPFRYEAPRWWRSERRFEGGPIERVEATCELRPSSAGTAVGYRVQLFPRGWLARPIVAADASLSTRPQLDRALRTVVATLRGEPPPDRPPALAPGALRRVEQGLAGVTPAAVAAEIRRIVTVAPLVEQDRIRPLAVARRLGHPEDDVLRAFLAAVRAGVLELRWELLCPSCQGPKASLDALPTAPLTVHCPSCNIRYDGSFPDAVEVVFRPAPEVREVDVPVDCLMSPARVPHVLARLRLPARGEAEITLDLPPGGYQIETLPSVGGAAIEVREGLRQRAIAVDATDEGVAPATLRIAPGPVTIAVRSRRDRDVDLKVERRWRPDHALTAGRLLELPDARDLLPPAALAPDVEVSVRQGVALAVGTVSRDQALLAALAGRLADAEASTMGNGTIVAWWPRFAEALAAAGRVAGLPGAGAGLAAGTITCLKYADGDAMVAGSAVRAALATMRAVGGQRVGLDGATAATEEATVALVAASVRARPAGGHVLLDLPPAPRHGTGAVPSPVVGGRFRLAEEIGRGGMGAVYAARDAQTGGDLVVKVLRPELATDPAHAQRLFAEARITARLRHPNVVEVVDWGKERDGRVWIAMERLDGAELQDRIAQGPLLPDEVRDLAAAVLDGLHAAHEAGIVHRDVKPPNVFLLRDGGVKVIDFGIAKAVDEEDELAEDGVVVGTPTYISPEQLQFAPLDGRADIYAVGVMLYECLAGRPPFHGAAPLIVAMQRLELPPPPLDTAAPDVPKPLAAAVMRALEVDPERRYATARDMQRALLGNTQRRRDR